MRRKRPWRRGDWRVSLPRSVGCQFFLRRGYWGFRPDPKLVPDCHRPWHRRILCALDDHNASSEGNAGRVPLPRTRRGLLNPVFVLHHDCQFNMARARGHYRPAWRGVDRSGTLVFAKSQQVGAEDVNGPFIHAPVALGLENCRRNRGCPDGCIPVGRSPARKEIWHGIGPRTGLHHQGLGKRARL